MQRTLLVDADIVAYQFAAKAERKYAFGTAVDDLDVVTPKVDEWLADLKHKLKATGIIICLSDLSINGWRKDILPSYKENRSEVVKPELLGPIKDYMEQAYPSYRRPRLEADDIMGILSTMTGLPGNFVKDHPEFADAGQKVIVSEDKDMKTIPGWLFNPAKDTKPRLIDEAEANYWHLYQALVGDTTDGYKGCPGCGPDKASPALKEVIRPYPIHKEITRGPNKGKVKTTWEMGEADSMWDVVVGWFNRFGSTEADALVQAQVARICRSSDYDFKEKRVIPWTPTTQSPTASTVGTAS